MDGLVASLAAHERRASVAQALLSSPLRHHPNDQRAIVRVDIERSVHLKMRAGEINGHALLNGYRSWWNNQRVHLRPDIVRNLAGRKFICSHSAQQPLTDQRILTISHVVA